MPSPPSTSTVRAAGPCALGDEHRAPAVGEPALGVGERPGGVAAVGLGGVHAQLEGVAAPSQRPSAPSAANGRHRPPHHAQLAGPVPDVRDATTGRPRRRRWAPRRRPRWPPRTPGGTPARSPPGPPPASAPAPGRTRRPSRPWAGRRAAAPCRRRGPARGTPCPRRRCPRRSCRAVRPARGGPRRGRRPAARTSSVSSSSRQGGAHRPCSATSRERWSATLK